MPRWRRWLPYSIPIRNRTPRREPATSPDPSQDATCVVPPYTGRETVDSPRRPVPLPKRSRAGSATIRSVPPRMKYPDGTHCDRPRLGAAGSTSSVFGARDRGLAPDTVRHQEPPTNVVWDAPLVGKPDVVPKSVAVRSGTVVCAASWCGTFLAAGPYGVREIGSKSQWRARWPIVGYWFFRPRLADRLPLPCPPSCLPSPVGTFPAHAHWGDRAVTPDDLISRLLRVPGLANASSLHGSDSQTLRCGRNGPSSLPVPCSSPPSPSRPR